jgi:NAD(P)-dependent dehydrogenase (short-subunit alcohol dehydrogenase family)
MVHMAGLGPNQGDPARVIDVNLGGTMRLVEAIRDHMAQGSAAVLIASNSAYFPKKAEAAELVCGPLTSDQLADVHTIAPTPQEAYPLAKLGVIALVKREGCCQNNGTGYAWPAVSPANSFGSFPDLMAFCPNTGVKRGGTRPHPVEPHCFDNARLPVFAA